MSENDFQTPLPVAKYMQSLIPIGTKTLLESTPGIGNLIYGLSEKHEITAAIDFFRLDRKKYDCVIMNPPFTSNEAILDYASREVKRLTGSKIGTWFLYEMLTWSDNVIALMPWYTIINSERRTQKLIDFGLVSIANLSRCWFNTRIQLCVLQLKRGWNKQTVFRQV